MLGKSAALTLVNPANIDKFPASIVTQMSVTLSSKRTVVQPAGIKKCEVDSPMPVAENATVHATDAYI